ncbi:MAG TPA: hypothetical protein DC017_05095 [Candidatus Wallbacteria bacterium]|nr:hypothetical protein [Candidatus Wallbacteria bacterium]
MLRKLENYHRPEKLDDALRLLDECGAGARILAGGTAVMAGKNNEIKTLIDIKNTGLDKVSKRKNGVEAGAAVTIAGLLESPEIKKYCGGLVYEAAYHIASTPLRNMITLGGNITQVFPWSDLPAALLACGAELTVAGPGGVRKLLYADAVKKHPTQMIAKNEIVTGVNFPELPGYVGKFTKFSKTSFDFALLDACVAVKIKNGMFEDARFAVSAAGTLPQLLNESAALLKGVKTTDSKAVSNAVQKAVSETVFTGDKRVSVEYKKQILPVLIERLIDAAIKQNEGADAK